MTNAELIAEARRRAADHPVCRHYETDVPLLTDALEASEAQVARFKKIVRHYRDAKVMADETAWPADLLEAVRHLAYCDYESRQHLHCESSRAVLRRYRLLPEERQECAYKTECDRKGEHVAPNCPTEEARCG